MSLKVLYLVSALITKIMLIVRLIRLLQVGFVFVIVVLGCWSLKVKLLDPIFGEIIHNMAESPRTLIGGLGSFIRILYFLATVVFPVGFGWNLAKIINKRIPDDEKFQFLR